MRQHVLFLSVQFCGRRSTSCGARKNHRACAFLDFFDRCANTRCFYRCSLAGGGQPLAVPEKIIGLALSSIFSTAAPTRAVFIAAVWRAAVNLLRCPKKSSGLRFPRFFRPLRQHALPSSAAGSGRACCLPCSNPFLHFGIKKAHTPKRCMCFFGTPEGIFPPLPRLSPRCARCPRQRKQPTGLFSSECFAFSCLVRIPSYDDKKNTKAVKNCFGVFGTPEGIRTPDLLVRSA